MSKKRSIANRLQTNDEPVAVLENSELKKLRAQVKNLSRMLSDLNVESNELVKNLEALCDFHIVLNQLIGKHSDAGYETLQDSKGRLFAIREYLQQRGDISVILNP